MKKKIPLIIISVVFSIIIWGTISLSEEYYTSVDVPLQITGIPKNYTIGTEIPEKITLKLNGEGWKLLSVKIGKDVSYKVSVNNDSGFKNLKLMDYLTDNRWMLSELNIMDIIPTSVSIKLERSVRKKLPIVADMVLDFKAGYGLAKEVKLTPDSIVVSGPLSLLKILKEIYTQQIKLSSLDRSVIKNTGFAPLPGTTFETDFVAISLDVQRIVDKQFDDINVDVLDVPPDRNVILLPNKISCSVRGGIDILGKLEKDKFRAYIFYRDVVLDTLGSVVPKVEIPDNTSLQFIKPEHLRYVIKTFR